MSPNKIIRGLIRKLILLESLKPTVGTNEGIVAINR